MGGQEYNAKIFYNMKRNKKRKRTRQVIRALGSVEYSGPAANSSEAYIATAKEGGLIVIAAIAACGVGAALGRHSLIAGIPVTLIGVHKGNPYIVAAGLALTVWISSR